MRLRGLRTDERAGHSVGSEVRSVSAEVEPQGLHVSSDVAFRKLDVSDTWPPVGFQEYYFAE